MNTSIQQLRHDLRGRANTILLCASALPLALDQKERLEFLDEITTAADKLLDLLDELEGRPEHFSESGTPMPGIRSTDRPS